MLRLTGEHFYQAHFFSYWAHLVKETSALFLGGVCVTQGDRVIALSFQELDRFSVVGVFFSPQACVWDMSSLGRSTNTCRPLDCFVSGFWNAFLVMVEYCCENMSKLPTCVCHHNEQMLIISFFGNFTWDVPHSCRRGPRSSSQHVCLKRGASVMFAAEGLMGVWE